MIYLLLYRVTPGTEQWSKTADLVIHLPAMDDSQRVIIVTVMGLACSGTVSGHIKIISSAPSSGQVVEEGGTVTFSCQTDRRWFLCLWTSPLGAKVCSIQESDAGASQVCQGDHRITVQGSR